MNEQFAYSVNGEHYRGAYATREEALAEALAEARRGDDSPPMVYVARRVPGDAMASGHARAVIGNICSRAREEFGDTASSYLTGVSRPQVEKLDKALTAAIESWLARQRIIPHLLHLRGHQLASSCVRFCTADRRRGVLKTSPT